MEKTMTSKAISAQGTTFEISDMAPTTPVFTAVADVKSYSGFDGQSSELDVTNLASTAKEYRAGLQDNGNLQLDMNIVDSDAGQQALADAKASGDVTDFKLTLPPESGQTTGALLAFSGFVKQFSRQGGVDAVQTGTVNIRITGDVTVTAGS